MAAAVASPVESAEWRPGTSLEIIVSVEHGGGTDTTARILQKLFDGLLPGTSTHVINKPHADGAEAWAYLQRLEGRGDHLAISTPQLLTNRIMGVDPHGFSDFTPITNLYNEYVLIAVSVDSPIKTGRDLVARLRGPTPVSVAIAPSLGSHNHIAAALVANAVGTGPKRLKVEVFRTGTEAALAVSEGRIDIVSSTAGTLLEHVRSGKLRALGKL